MKHRDNWVKARKHPLLKKGSKFGLLTIEYYKGVNNFNKRRYQCICVCGNRKIVVSGSLKSGNTTSCGCVRIKGLKYVREKHYGKEYLDNLPARDKKIKILSKNMTHSKIAEKYGIDPSRVTQILRLP